MFNDIQAKAKDLLTKAHIDLSGVAMWSLFLCDTGHTGAVFSARERGDRTALGYLVALALDLTAAASLHKLTHTAKRAHRVYAAVVFLAACAVPVGFGFAYYRQTSPADPVWLSWLFGGIAPILAGAMAGLRAMGQAERTKRQEAVELARIEAERQAQVELERFRILQEQETARAIEAEKTKQERAKARATKAKAEATKRQRMATERQERESLGQRVGNLGQAVETLRQFVGNPMATHAQVAATLGISRRTVGNHLAKAEELGVIHRNGQGVEVLADLSAF